MKKLFTSVMLLISILLTYSQQKKLVSNKGVVKTSILKGSIQKISTECGYGNTSIKQTVTTYFFSKSKRYFYQIETILWVQYTDKQNYDCAGTWGYELSQDKQTALSSESLIREKNRQSKIAFELLKYMQIEGNL